LRLDTAHGAERRAVAGNGLRRLLRTGRGRAVFAFGVVLIAAAAVLARGELWWRFAVVDMKLHGQVPGFEWGELLWNLRPQSPIYLRSLPLVRNPDLAIQNPFSSPADSVAGADVFRSDCSSCHGPEGRGGVNAPALTIANSPRSRTDWGLFRTIARGVPGTAMHAHELPPRTIWQLVDYIKSLRAGEVGTVANQPVDVPFSKLLNAASDSTGWYTYSGDYQSHRFSRLSMINARNVAHLRVAWQYQSAAMERVFESSPVVVNGVLYYTEPPATVVAIDAIDGSTRWRYARLVPDAVPLCCGSINRGVAILDSLLFVGTLDAHLVALSARSGRVIWDREVADWREGYSITGAPLAIGGKVVTGVAGGEYGVRGFLAAFDAATGRRQWQFWTVPSPGEKGSESWLKDSWKHGGAPTWLTGSYDPALNLLYWGVGNPAPNFNGDGRDGDNLYSNSVVAIDADSGKLRWHFQFTPHDEHDWDAVQIPVLFDATYGGTKRSLMGWANRNAFFYLLDRKTGEFLLARPFAKQSWADSIDSKGRPHVRLDSRPTHDGALVSPGVAGATNWWSPSYSPRTGLLYVPTLEESSVVFREAPHYRQGEMYMGSVSQPSNEAGTSVTAIDPLTGAIKWHHTFEPRSEWHRIGGILSLGGDLLFVGNGSVLHALDARTGSELWRFNTGGQIAAAPITYFANGRQYLAIAAGRALLAFALDERPGNSPN